MLSHYYLAADLVEAARRLFITLHCHAVVWHVTLEIGHRHWIIITSSQRMLLLRGTITVHGIDAHLYTAVGGASRRSLLNIRPGAILWQLFSVRYSLMISLLQEVLVLCSVITAPPLINVVRTLINPLICVLGISEASNVVHVLIVATGCLLGRKGRSCIYRGTCSLLLLH